jgi:hypothetical protein
MKNGKPKPPKKAEPEIEVRVKLYAEYDGNVIEYIRNRARAAQRSTTQQIKFMLHQAAGGAQ